MARLRLSRDWVVLTLAIGLATALNLFAIAVFLDAVRSKDPGLSENAAQVLSGWGTGIIGIIGTYVGSRARDKRISEKEENDDHTQ